MSLHSSLSPLLSISSDRGTPIPEDSNVADFIVDLTYIKEEQDTLPEENSPESGNTGPPPFNRVSQMPSDATIDFSGFGVEHEHANETTRYASHMHRGRHGDPFKALSKEALFEARLRRHNSSHTLPSIIDADTSSITTTGPHPISHDSLIDSYRYAALAHLNARRKSRLHKMMSDLTRGLAQKHRELESEPVKLHYPTPFLRQVETLVQRSVTNMARARGEIVSSFGLASANLIFYGLFYLGLKTEVLSRTDLAYVQSLRSFIFQIVNGICLLELDILARGMRKHD